MVAGAGPTEKISIALDFVQGKRRVEGVVEAAAELAGSLGRVPDPSARLGLVHEVICRDLGPDVMISCDEMFWPVPSAGLPHQDADRPARLVAAALEHRLTLVGPDLAPVIIVARHRPPGRLRLTAEEWSSALRLMGSIAAVAVGRRLEWAP
ncbi:hypothetical protein [Frankia sp. AgKG'84/4]|uniref:hypothetical protein n=1 Tax=Frankia sp. AgKG'84/4 TaxID=573490 RepID=UPI00202A4CB9|nr:hypothetical protein [Frankia sp. AgKG'84/4]MCL9793442.1 hypothetical protein [Frankia sp. AgKG'84/4]